MGPMPSPEALRTRRILRTLVRPFAGRVPVSVQRRFMEAILRNAEPPRGVRVEPVDAGGVPGELLIPDGVPAGRMLYYLHGGGYILGSLGSHRRFVAALAKRLGIRALHIDYRLAPEHPHPAAVDDALAAYAWLLDQGTRPADMIIGGESAGGGLTLATLLALRDQGRPLPGLGFVISPWVDLTMSGRSVRERRRLDPMIPASYLYRVARHYHGPHSPAAPLVSPLHADLRGLPPMLIHVGEHEVLHDDAVQLAANLRRAGNDVTFQVYDDLFHAFHLFGHLPEARQAVDDIAAFVKNRPGH